VVRAPSGEAGTAAKLDVWIALRSLSSGAHSRDPLVAQ
jgi:hypothetical protein